MHPLLFKAVLKLPLLLDFLAACPYWCNNSSRGKAFNEIHAIQHDHGRVYPNIVPNIQIIVSNIVRNNVSSLVSYYHP